VECDGELEWINVVPERRGSGIAPELLRMLAAWFVAQKASRVCVNVAENNATARRFYTRHGAEHLGKHWMVWKDIQTALGERQDAMKPPRAKSREKRGRKR